MKALTLATLPPSIPADGRGQLRMKVLEEVSEHDEQKHED